MHCFPMLSDAYAAALLGSDEGARESREDGAISVTSSRTCLAEPVKASSEEEDLETARTRPLRLDALHL